LTLFVDDREAVKIMDDREAVKIMDDREAVNIVTSKKIQADPVSIDPLPLWPDYNLPISRLCIFIFR
jgi:hypothetical protein